MQTAKTGVRRMFVMSSIIVAALLLVTPTISTSVSAAIGPTNVRGYVSDSEGYSEAGADVVVDVRRASDDSIRATLSDTTDDDGFYSVTFGPSDWDIGDRIEVTSTWQGHVASNSTTASDSAIQWVNVTYGYVIPEFGGLSLVVATLSVVALFLLVRTRRKD